MASSSRVAWSRVTTPVTRPSPSIRTRSPRAACTGPLGCLPHRDGHAEIDSRPIQLARRPGGDEPLEPIPLADRLDLRRAGRDHHLSRPDVQHPLRRPRDDGWSRRRPRPPRPHPRSSAEPSFGPRSRRLLRDRFARRRSPRPPPPRGAPRCAAPARLGGRHGGAPTAGWRRTSRSARAGVRQVRTYAIPSTSATQLPQSPARQSVPPWRGCSPARTRATATRVARLVGQPVTVDDESGRLGAHRREASTGCGDVRASSCSTSHEVVRRDGTGADAPYLHMSP